ncbi:hypothetical protein TSUD_75000 [Trifolium subterraneum]|nr:hypothetical protein TSUD_75000 [Trifolium subterraneum]
MISKLTFCVTCGRRSFHLQKSRGSACAYPAARIRKHNWSGKAIRRKTTETDRMKVLAIHENGGAEEFIVQFAVEIWSQAGNSMDSNAPFEEKVNLTVTLMYYNLH